MCADVAETFRFGHKFEVIIDLEIDLFQANGNYKVLATMLLKQ